MNDNHTPAYSLQFLIEHAKELYEGKVTGLIYIDNFEFPDDYEPHEQLVIGSHLPTDVNGSYKVWHVDDYKFAVFAFELLFGVN